jgi:predicted ArsR family transcriptional regulator
MPLDPTDVQAVALLDEPVRRRLFEAVARSGHAVSRDDAAAAAGVSRALAAFHLDRLVAGGLLATEYRRLSGRAGPGAGRPAKLYRSASRDVAVSIPDRDYELPARLFAAALDAEPDGGPPGPVRRAAHDLGQSVGTAARSDAGPRPSSRRLRAALLATLDARGYAPHETPDGQIRLGNCPFHGLVEEHRDLVCGMNLALAEGMLTGLRDPRLGARLDPQPGQCCVAFTVRDTPMGHAGRRSGGHELPHQQRRDPQEATNSFRPSGLPPSARTPNPG